MTYKTEMFFSNLKKKRVAVVGLGVSHFDLVKLFLKKGIDVTVLDKREKEALGEDYEALRALGAKFILGGSYLEGLNEFEVVFRTPGMYFLSEAINKAREAGVVVTSEMECFFDLCPCKIYALTGSDGKTTTSTLISEFLKADGKKVHLGGNIGKALLPIVEEIEPDDFCVVELSSFQLISMRRSPDVAVLTNVQPNHLDVHKDMAEYIDSKKNLLIHQNAFSKTVLNLDNEVTNSMSGLVRGELCFFSRRQSVKNGAYLDRNGDLIAVKQGSERKILNKNEIRIPGIHNVENFLAAIAAASDDVSDEAIIKVAHEFGGVEHRIEYVRTVDGVRYYNDSIASSPTRTIAGLYSFDRKLVIIAGGYDKKIPYEPLGKPLCERAKLLILLGATADKIEKAVVECPDYNKDELKIVRVKTLEEAVEKARELTSEGDVVSLSPASASFDLYRNFEERGRHFKNIVNGLK